MNNSSAPVCPPTTFSPSLALHFNENLVRHVQSWPSDHVEKQVTLRCVYLFIHLLYCETDSSREFSLASFASGLLIRGKFKFLCEGSSDWHVCSSVCPTPSGGEVTRGRPQHGQHEHVRDLRGAEKAALPGASVWDSGHTERAKVTNPVSFYTLSESGWGLTHSWLKIWRLFRSFIIIYVCRN